MRKPKQQPVKEIDIMAVIPAVLDLIAANQKLVALVNQLITKVTTPPSVSPDVADTAAAAASETNAVNAANDAATAALSSTP